MRVDPEIRAAIARDYRNRVSVETIAEKYNCSRSFPVKIAKEFGIPLHGRGGSRRKGALLAGLMSAPQPERPPLDIDEVRRLKARGFSLTQIAAFLRHPYRDIAAALT